MRISDWSSDVCSSVFETARGECAPGQYEITFPYGAALSVADGHVLYKTAAKAVSAAHGVSLTFMATYDEAEGNSSHVQFSLRTPEGELLFPAGPARGDPGRGTDGGWAGLAPIQRNGRGA